MSAELEIPQEAQRAYDRATIELMLTAKTGQLGSLSAPDNVRAIATPVVVAYVRKLSEMAVEGPLSADDLNGLANLLEAGESS